MADLTVQTSDENGGVTFSAAAAGGDAFLNDGTTMFVVQNDGAGAVAVSFTAQKTALRHPQFGEITKANGGGSVAAGGVDVFGPFPHSVFNDAANKVQITYDQVTSVTVAAVRPR